MDYSEMGHYDIMADYGTPYFHWGGLDATNQLVNLCHIEPGQRVLVVGCGTGYTACHIAKTYQCEVVGIDISPRMIERAQERIEKMQLHEKVVFQVADAYELPFPEDSFDIVMTEFVSVFLEKPRVMFEYLRVLKPGGYVGVNELYRLDDVPDDAMEIITEAENAFEESTGLPLRMPIITQWQAWFEEVGFSNIEKTEIEGTISYGEYKTAVGGNVKILRMMGRVLGGLVRNGDLRRRMMKMGKIKDVLMRNKKTREYAGAVIITATKPR